MFVRVCVCNCLLFKNLCLARMDGSPLIGGPDFRNTTPLCTVTKIPHRSPNNRLIVVTKTILRDTNNPIYPTDCETYLKNSTVKKNLTK